MQRMINGFLAVLVVLSLPGLTACAHDPDPFARERSIEEEQQDERQALQASEDAMQRQRVQAARRDDGERNEQQENEESASGQENDQAAAKSARQRVRDASTTVRRMELPRLPTSQVITVPRVLNR